jgi:hypothetical protein
MLFTYPSSLFSYNPLTKTFQCDKTKLQLYSPNFVIQYDDSKSFCIKSDRTGIILKFELYTSSIDGPFQFVSPLKQFSLVLTGKLFNLNH